MKGFSDDTGPGESSPQEVPEQTQARNKNRNTKEEIARVRELASTGLSALAIAQTIHASRNKVIGICHRNGIELKGKGGRKRTNSQPKKKAPYLTKKREVGHKTPRKRKPKPTSDLPSGPKAEFFGRRGKELVGYEAHAGVSLLELSKNNCHWPLGEPDDPPKTFCGKPAKGVYCAIHLHVKKYGSFRGLQ